MANDQWAKVSFDVATKVLGCDVELFDGSTVRVDPETNKPFRETRTGNVFSIEEMISNLLMKTNTSKQDLIRPAAAAEAFETGRCVGKPDLNITFGPGSVGLCLGDAAPRDIKRIVFDVEMTVTPKRNS